MKTRSSKSPVCNRLTRPRWLGLLVVILIAMPSIALISRRGFASPKAPSDQRRVESGAAGSPTPPLPLATIVVNTTGDGSNVDPNIACDVDAGTAGEQCTLRAAIERANTLAGDDTITFNIPTSEPNCDAGTGACIIQLTDTLPTLSTNIAIAGPGVDKLTVSRPALGTDFRLFNVTAAGVVTLSGLRIEKGFAPSSVVVGGGINYTGGGTLNVVECLFFDNRAVVGGAIATSGSGTLNIIRSGPGEDARNEQVALARVRRAEMVKAFIESGEYRRRFFGAPTGNQEGQAAGTNAGPP